VNATKQSGQTMSQQPNLLFLSYANSEAVEMSEVPNFREQPGSECLYIYNMFIYGCSVSRSFLRLHITIWYNLFVPQFDMDAACCSPLLSFDSDPRRQKV
jgi:hypothetical protein